MHYIFFLFCSLLFLSCGTSVDSEGFLSDYNVCKEGVAENPLYGSYSIGQALNDTSANNYLAQRYSTSTDKQLWGVKLLLSRTATAPSNGFRVRLLKGTSSSPDSSDVEGSSDIVLPSAIPTSDEWVKIQFSDIPHVQLNQFYWIELDPLYGDGAEYIMWYYNGTGSSFKKSSNETSWSTISNATASYQIIPCL